MKFKTKKYQLYAQKIINVIEKMLKHNLLRQ